MKDLVKHQIEFTRTINLTKEIVFLDGLTGTGKTMFGPLISSFDRIQNGRFEYIYEYLSILKHHNKISDDASSSLFKLISDIKLHDGLISREVNFRPKDLSSVFRSGKGIKYLRQLFYNDGNKLKNRIKNESPILFLITHQILSCMDSLFDTFQEKIKVIHTVRHPLHLIEHWASYIDNHGNESKDFTMWFKYNEEELPWFAHGWEEKYVNSNAYEKSIYAISKLYQYTFLYAKKNKRRENLLFLPFEHFVLNPKPYVSKLASFLSTGPTSKTNLILRAQKVPRKYVHLGPVKSIYKRYGFKKISEKRTDKEVHNNLMNEIKTKISDSALKTLITVSGEYESIFGKWF